MATNITLRTARASDGPAIAQTKISAYWENGNWRLMWEPRTRGYVTEQSTKREPRNLLSDREHKRVQVAVDDETGRIVGYARWALPDRLVPEWLDGQVPAVSEAEEKQHAATHAGADWQHRRELDVLDEPISAMMKRLFALHEYMELDFLAVHPDFKGRGIASQLVASGITKAEEMGVRIFVHSLEASVRLYQRLGFQMLDHVTQDDSRFGGPGEYRSYILEWTPLRLQT
ncbi:acyl-CoA N-acyltransferase [Microdochium bolleyi]|uniref:Acyl-CoA N-acyltransferase n=1 Tax=Microdochium bolleyi TaxID=196109 RepID=A0A136JKK2_9PEZI|nr:acyl-CoA N-acyltransferase [Microdochium bolleyi]